VKIEIQATILFETGRSTIKEESKTILNQVALQILQHPEVKKVRVEGHTDSMGNADDNLFLSQDRADSVRRYLITRGVAKDRLVAVGLGQEHPIATNDTAEGRMKNRRVEFVIEE
jgi:OOP family OmpA-OmpF porin